MRTKRLQLAVLLVLLIALGTLVLKQQALRDWWRLRGYTPPSTVAQLASNDTMTPRAEHLLYVNHPQVTSGSAFTNHCPSGGEKTVVLGCYIGADEGIYVYQVTDPRLAGVEQVTAAHEMLHAAYRRLSNSERSKVDAMLTDYYDHDLIDQRIKDTIAAYKQSEPNDVVNEMHSVFGTEIGQLPAPLEAYYKQYFTNRAAVAAYTAQYQSEFTSRQKQVATYDGQLKDLKQQIDTAEAQLKQQRTDIDNQASQLQSDQSSGQIAAYNAGVSRYNQSVNSYNALLVTTKNQINQYNDIVSARNSVVLEEQQLAGELSSGSLTTK